MDFCFKSTSYIELEWDTLLPSPLLLLSLDELYVHYSFIQQMFIEHLLWAMAVMI